jgi:hypothetical protein
MRLGVVTKARFAGNPPKCEKCGVIVQVGKQFYHSYSSNMKYCKKCGDKMYY